MDVASGKLTKTIPVQAQPERIALTPDETRAYVANLRARSMSVIDLARGEVIATIELKEYPFKRSRLACG
jgi:YVTN family beta-propeller protein